MSTILNYINKGKDERERQLEQVKHMLDNGAALPPPSIYPDYGYNLTGTTIAKLKPWAHHDAYKSKDLGSALNDEALFNVMQFNRMAVRGKAYECGVYNGGATRLLLKEGRRVVAFDTFEGVLGSQAGDLMEDGEYKCEAKDALIESLKPAECIVGDVRETLKNRYFERVAFAHLDMDIYSPTKFALDNIWTRLVVGGVIMLDDYGVWCTEGIKQAADEFLERTPYAKPIYLPTGQLAIIK